MIGLQATWTRRITENEEEQSTTVCLHKLAKIFKEIAEKTITKY